MRAVEVVVVGGGLAGLSCALHLQDGGREVLLLEADDRVGGRVRTDRVDGFLLDRGFQVLLTAYPEASRLLDVEALELGTFRPGALIRLRDGFVRLADPLRSPGELWSSIRAPVGTVGDKLRVLRLRSRLARSTGHPRSTETSTRDLLAREGFSTGMVERFFRPFLGGIFLEPDLETSAHFFEFVFAMFSAGYAALPAEGMEAIPRQLAGRLAPGTVRTGRRVTSVAAGRVELAGAETVPCRAVVVATERPAAEALLPNLPPRRSRSVSCLYFAAPEPPVDEAVLILDGTGQGPVNNVVVPDQVSPGYASGGESLVSVTVLGTPGDGTDELWAPVQAQLREWFGPGVEAWRRIRSYRIAHALPAQPPGSVGVGDPRAPGPPGVYVAGDHLDLASIEGALRSGRRAAEAVAADLAA